MDHRKVQMEMFMPTSVQCLYITTVLCWYEGDG